MKAENIAGQQFNELTAVTHAGGSFWECRCSCGVVVKVRKSHLLSGRIKSCGHVRKELINLLGRKFGMLLVVKRVGKVKEGSREIYWECKCDCGDSVILPSSALLNRGQTTCSRKRVEHGRFKDISGSVYGRLTAIKIAKRTNNGTWWTCLCSCGNTAEVLVGSLLAGDIKSCGCLFAESLLTRPKGPDHHNWNINIADEDREDCRKYEAYTLWATQVKSRDNYTCQLCGQRGGRLNSHHLDSYRAHPERRVDPTNGVTLCTTCHKAFHKQYGNKINYEWQYYEFRNLYLTNNLPTN